MRTTFVAALVLASVIIAQGCTRTPQLEFPVVQKYTARAGDLFYFRPGDSHFVLIERRDALAVAVAPVPNVQAYAYDTRIAVGRPQRGGVEIRSLVEGIRPQRALAITPDGRMLAGGDEYGYLTLWDLRTGETWRSWKEPAPILAVAFSPDGGALAIGLEKPPGKSMDTVRIWDLDANAPRRSLGGHDTAAVTWVPDGRTLAAGEGNGTVLVAEIFGESAARPLQSSTAAVTALAFHPAGTYLAAAHADKRVVLWDVASGKAIFTLDPEVPADPLFPRGIERVGFDPGGARLAVAYADGDFRIWDTSALAKIARK
jgi:WD40 repeat protein